MAKTKTPLLSLGATGSIGGALTHQKKGDVTIIRRKPVPKQPNTDRQIWHRYLYQNCCDYWNTLSAAQKQVWETDARRHHMTGFALFIKTRLAQVHELRLCTPMDESAGELAQDYSANYNHGTIYGATWADGIIGSCLYFDGINDYVEIPDSDILEPFPALHIEFWLKPLAGMVAWAGYLSKITGFPYRGYAFRRATADNIINFIGFRNAGNSIFRNVTLNAWNFIMGDCDGVTMTLSVNNGVPASKAIIDGRVDSPQPLTLGKMSNIPVGYRTKGWIDEVRMLPRVLTTQERTEHYERRHPS